MSWVLSIADQPEWMERAGCQGSDGEAFFPEKGGSTYYAKLICSRCEVKPECRAFALETRQPAGIWGGLSERQRRKLLRKLDAEPVAGGSR